jgi:hypothetical protein
VAGVRAVIGEFISDVHHCVPLQYVPALVQSKMLLSKEQLLRRGHMERHFRSTSRRRDVESGFTAFVHTMNSPSFPLIDEKLRRGLPHVVISIPVGDLPDKGLLVCRYNIAKHRMPPGGWLESDRNGWLLPGLSVPVASTPEDVESLIRHRLPKWFEVLVPDGVPISRATVRAFDEQERECVEAMCALAGMGDLRVVQTESTYERANDEPLDYLREVLRGKPIVPIPQSRFD